MKFVRVFATAVLFSAVSCANAEQFGFDFPFAQPSESPLVVSDTFTVSPSFAIPTQSTIVRTLREPMSAQIIPATSTAPMTTTSFGRSSHVLPTVGASELPWSSSVPSPMPTPFATTSTGSATIPALSGGLPMPAMQVTAPTLYSGGW
jgi:hypothetical protein